MNSGRMALLATCHRVSIGKYLLQMSPLLDCPHNGELRPNHYVSALIANTFKNRYLFLMHVLSPADLRAVVRFFAYH